ncbi:MAG TPA: hypothetical protein ENI85_05890 [Deltaproteobacteria bacterium]|nr:hypothetical protein [Deltaproteobacteria bacterium]
MGSHRGETPLSDESNPLGDIRVDIDNLYREDTFTDLKVASIRRLTPIKADGSDDPSRPVMFVGETTLMSARGPLPINCPIEASTLAEALDAFPQAIQDAVERLMEEAREMQRQEASRIVVPGQGGPVGGGPLGGPPGGGRIIG